MASVANKDSNFYHMLIWAIFVCVCAKPNILHFSFLLSGLPLLLTEFIHCGRSVILCNCSQVHPTEHLCQWISIGSGNRLVPSGNKSLSEPMLTHLCIAIQTRNQTVEKIPNQAFCMFTDFHTNIDNALEISAFTISCQNALQIIMMFYHITMTPRGYCNVYTW